MTSRDVNYVQANGLRFGYLSTGEGPLVLCVHGFPDTAETMRPLVEGLAASGFHAVAPFTRGIFPTEVPKTSKTTLEELAADLVALVPALGHERAAMLIGHDWGAAASYLAAGIAPERFEKLTAVAIPHPYALKPSLRLLWLGRHFVGLRLPGAATRFAKNDFERLDGLYRRWSPTWSFGPEETRPAKEAYSEAGSLDAALGYYRGASFGKIPSLPKKIAVPTLAVAGTDDAVSEDIYHSASRYFDEYEVAALPGGHFVHRESPDAFLALIRERLG